MPETSPSLSPTNIKVGTDEASTSSECLLDIADKPKDLSVLAFVVTILFNNVLGYFAYHFTASAQHSWKLKNYETSKRHAKYAIIFIVLGLILGGVTYTIALSVYFTSDKDPACSSTPSAYNSSRQTNTEPSSLDTTTTATTIATTLTTIAVTTTCCKHCTGQTDQHCRVYCTSSDPGGPIYIPRSPDRKYEICCMFMSCTP